MNFSAWAVHRPIPPILLFVVLAIAGIYGFARLGVQNMPDIDFPAVVVTAALPGATPNQLETEITRKIEDSVASVGMVRYVKSSVVDGVSTTLIFFEIEKNLQEAVDDVRDAVTSIRADLPSDVREPIISRISVMGGATMTYAVSADGMDEADLSWFVDDTIGKTLLSVQGVGQVTRRGGVTREIAVDVDPIRLQAMNLTVGEVSRQLRAVQQEAPGGRGAVGAQEQAVRTIGTVSTVAELSTLAIPTADGRQVRLGDVADVRDTTAERRQIALLDGQPVISFQVSRARGFDDVGVAQRVRNAVDVLHAAHPRIRMVEVSNVTDLIESQYEAAMRALYAGAFLAVVVVWLFLRDWRATFVSAMALPLSIIPTFAVMYFLDYSLNMITLLGLILVVGVLVDDAIVEVENIMRHLRDGKPPLQAALDAAGEIGLAVIATSMALVAVFLPTAAMGDIFGMLFRQFGITTSVAVLASLLVARLLTPLMAAYILKPQPHVEHEGPVLRRYLRAVTWCLKHPWMTCGSAAAFFVASLTIVGFLPVSFTAPGDHGQITVTVEGAPGSTLVQTHELAEQARKLLHDLPEAKSIYASIGTGASNGGRFGGATGEVRTANLQINLTPIDSRERHQPEIEADVRRRLAPLTGARVSVGGGGFGGELFEVVLTGSDVALLQRTAQAVESDLRGLPGLGNVISSASLLRPEIVIRPDFARAARQGVTVAAIGEAVRIGTTGDYEQVLSKLNLPNRQLSIRVQLEPGSRNDLDTIRQLRVRGATGMVPLENVADIGMEGGPAQISRYDRARDISITVELQGRPLGDVLKEAAQLPSLRELPPGVTRIESGEAERVAKMMGGFGFAMLVGVLCVYVVLVLLFNDFAQPITILAALPLAVGGALGMLVILRFSLSISTVIGLVMLMGIVSKNSILLVEYALMAQRDYGHSRTEAIIEACRKRARPILMTTIAMIAGMLPMALGLEGDATFSAPMGAAVIGGLITSTALSLLVVPVVFELVDDAKRQLRKRFGGRRIT